MKKFNVTLTELQIKIITQALVDAADNGWDSMAEFQASEDLAKVFEDKKEAKRSTKPIKKL